MPFKWRDSVKNFRWKVDQESGLPVATVEPIGDGRYIMACNLCGCSHCLLANQPTVDAVYEPLCVSEQYADLWALYRKSWIREHPDAARHRAIKLISAEALAVMPETKETAPLALVEKPKRKPQRRKKAA